MEFKNELWKTIKGYDGRYQISDKGRIWNTAQYIYMKPQLKKNGYYQVNLMKPNKKVVTERVHRLVALAFCPKPKNANVVNHLDMDKTNNKSSNLEWTTVSGNTKHCYENSEKFRKQVKENSILGANASRLTLEVRDKNNKVIGIYNGIEEAAEALELNEKTIRNIKDNKFPSNRRGYTINEIARGGEPIDEPKSAI